MEKYSVFCIIKPENSLQKEETRMKQRIAALLCACGLLLTGCGAQQAQPAPTAQPSPTAQPVIQDYPWEFAWQEGARPPVNGRARW